MKKLFGLLIVGFALGAALPALAGDGVAVAELQAAPSLRPVPDVRSGTVLVVDRRTRQPLLYRNEGAVAPIASITKLMTAMVILDARQSMVGRITIGKADVDHYKVSHSRLTLGTTLSRATLLRLALMASENRAAAALARSYPGGRAALVAAMNRKAAALGMKHSRFVGPTGLKPENTSTAEDLVRLVEAAARYRTIRHATTLRSIRVMVGKGRHRHAVTYRNTDLLVRNRQWHIVLSKTGYISEAGRCLVVQASIAGRETVIVLLDSWGRLTRVGDANRIRKWLETRARRHRRDG